MAVAVVAVVVVVDRAVRSAGKAFSFERELGPQRCGLSHFKCLVLTRTHPGSAPFGRPTGVCFGILPARCAIRVYDQCGFAYNRGPRRGAR